MSDLEPGRPATEFRCYIMTGPKDAPATTGIEIPAEALQDVYDIATDSLDFGSGFLSTEEVQHIRQLGKAIGAPPLHYQCKGQWESQQEDCTCGANEVPFENDWIVK